MSKLTIDDILDVTPASRRLRAKRDLEYAKRKVAASRKQLSNHEFKLNETIIREKEITELAAISYSLSELMRKRWWTLKLVKQYLGDPDNYMGWLKNRVIEIESKNEVKTALIMRRLKKV